MMILNKEIKKIEPLCRVFGECGGCLYQDLPYEVELSIKETYLKKIFKEQLNLPVEIFEKILPSPSPYHYRNRLDLKLLRRKDGQIQIGFSPEGRFKVVEVESCPIARREISEFLPELKRQAVAKLPPKYRVANLVVRSGDERNVFWGGIGRRSLEQNVQDFLSTTVNGKRIFYSLSTFFQANLDILPGVMAKINSLVEFGTEAIFFDLYGGVGLFSIALAERVKKVYLIEESPASIKLAWFNKGFHNLNNLEIIEGRVEEYLPNLLNMITETQPIAFIDPPRNGLSPSVLEVLSQARTLSKILYLSCHPESLVRDLKLFLTQGWQVTKVCPFDFFPRTKHLETFVILEPKK